MLNLVFGLILGFAWMFALGGSQGSRNKTKLNDKDICFMFLILILLPMGALMMLMYVINDAHNAMMLRMENIDNVEKIDVM